MKVNFKMMGKAVICGLVMSFVMSGCGQSVTEVETPPTAVEVSKVGLSSIENKIIFAGQIKPFDSVSVMPKMAGKVKAAYFEVGDTVNEGDVLFTLDEEDINNQIRTLTAQLYQAELGVTSAQTGVSLVTGGQYESQILQQEIGIEGAKKQLEAAKNALANAEIGVKNAQVTVDNAQVSLNSTQVAIDNSQVTINNAKVAISNAELGLQTATTNFENAKVLYASGLTTKKEYDLTETAYKQAISQLEQANNGYEQAMNGAAQTKTQLAAAKNSYEQAKNGLETAKNSYAAAELGVTQAETALAQAQKGLGLTEGQIVSENRTQKQQGVETAKAAVEVVRANLETAQSTLKNTSVTAPMSGVISTKSVNSSEFASTQSPAYTIVESGIVKVSVKASELIINKLAVGDSINVFINSLSTEPFVGKIKTISPTADQTGTYPINIEIDNYDGKIKPGMFAEVHMILEKSEDTIILPINTVLKSDKESYVYINDNGAAKKVVVTTGITDGNNIEILTGLFKDDQVIVKGHTFITDAQKINVIEKGQKADKGE